MRNRSLLLLPVVCALLVAAGCASQSAAPTAEDAESRTAETPRPVNRSGDVGLTCIDDLDDVQGGPGYDLERVSIGIDSTHITTTFTAGQKYHWDDANLRLGVSLTDSITGRTLALEAFVRDNGQTTLQQNGGGRWRDVLQNSAPASITDDGPSTIIAWPIGDLDYTVPASFTWNAYVTYSNKHDTCPGNGDGDIDIHSAMSGAWTVPALD